MGSGGGVGVGVGVGASVRAWWCEGQGWDYRVGIRGRGEVGVEAGLG